MKRVRLASSKLLERRWNEQDHQIHRQRIRTVRSAVRTQFHNPPYQHNNVNRQAKRDATKKVSATETKEPCSCVREVLGY